MIINGVKYPDMTKNEREGVAECLMLCQKMLSWLIEMTGEQGGLARTTVKACDKLFDAIDLSKPMDEEMQHHPEIVQFILEEYRKDKLLGDDDEDRTDLPIK